VLNIRNRHDPALKIYPLHRPFASRALGSAGFTRSDFRKLERACWKLKELDVTDEFGHVHYWPEYFNRPWVAARLRNFVHATDVHAYASR
jgi:hypothetical protein